MRFLPGNAQHIGARQYQQDSFGFADPDDQAFISHGGFLAIVCDGMGGMEHGDAASRTAVKAFLEAYSRKTPEESIPAALERCVFEANSAVVGLALRFGKLEGVGTTLVAMALDGLAMYYVSVGDSGLFHASGGQIQMVNHHHVYANMLDQAVARGQITLEAALAHPERESLTSYIGAEKLEEVDRNIDPWPLQDGDTILLASDGMFKTLDPAEILDCLRGNPTAWPDGLVQSTLAKHREYQDNVTVLSVTVESESRATVPRTVLMAPPPPAAAGVPAESGLGPPRTVMVPAKGGAAVPNPASPPPANPAPALPQGNWPPASPPPGLPQAFPPQALPPQAFPPQAFPQPGSPASVPGRSRVGAWVAGLLLLLAAAGGGGWWYWTHRLPQSGFGGGKADPTKETKAPPRDPNQPLPLPEPKPSETKPPPRLPADQERKR